jgi:hypothetical protein
MALRITGKRFRCRTMLQNVALVMASPTQNTIGSGSCLCCANYSCCCSVVGFLTSQIDERDVWSQSFIKFNHVLLRFQIAVRFDLSRFIVIIIYFRVIGHSPGILFERDQNSLQHQFGDGQKIELSSARSATSRQQRDKAYYKLLPRRYRKFSSPWGSAPFAFGVVYLLPLCHTWFPKRNQVHLICASGSVHTQMIDKNEWNIINSIQTYFRV